MSMGPFSTYTNPKDDIMMFVEYELNAVDTAKYGYTLDWWNINSMLRQQ